jgi:hypothetical protein
VAPTTLFHLTRRMTQYYTLVSHFGLHTTTAPYKSHPHHTIIVIRGFVPDRPSIYHITSHIMVTLLYHIISHYGSQFSLYKFYSRITNHQEYLKCSACPRCFMRLRWLLSLSKRSLPHRWPFFFYHPPSSILHPIQDHVSRSIGNAPTRANAVCPTVGACVHPSSYTYT